MDCSSLPLLVLPPPLGVLLQRMRRGGLVRCVKHPLRRLLLHPLPLLSCCRRIYAILAMVTGQTWQWELLCAMRAVLLHLEWVDGDAENAEVHNFQQSRLIAAEVGLLNKHKIERR